MKKFTASLLIVLMGFATTNCRSPKKTTRVDSEKSDPKHKDIDSDDSKEKEDPVVDGKPRPQQPTVRNYQLEDSEYQVMVKETEDHAAQSVSYTVMITKGTNQQFDEPVKFEGDVTTGVSVSFFERADSPNASELTLTLRSDRSCSVRWESNGAIDIFTKIFNGSCK